MDGVIDKGKSLHAYVIGATNQPWDLDWPFIRRFQKRILVPLPDHHSRLQMFKLYTGDLNLDHDIRLHELARLSEGFSGSDIKDTCQSAYLSIIGEFFESGKANDRKAKPRSMAMTDFRRILEDRKPSVSFDMVASYTKWYDAFKAL
jgi:SpoVK/Ycf46/Vps4 family AAA+-type ATPase